MYLNDEWDGELSKNTVDHTPNSFGEKGREKGANKK